MSIHSKSRRDARRKNAKSAPAQRPPTEHAHLVDGRGAVFGGAVCRAGAWVLVLGGKPAARTDSAAMVLAMLKHVASLREGAGDAVRLTLSTQLRDAATTEAAEDGKTLDEYLAQLAAEREERLAERRPS
ncbi:hypothetical protein [Arenimonas composti]|uniref:Uncharacterized protein n=1 Tax=Arenimonas composti TR7-09 = DSM 18010 TaxID=1121013 RepID=A0A091BWK3_9GAMM|nr:hypothetical protein [Arenimonas composti]KFN48725.1 hypothetical protein P873_13795 [Arenimonas composti TR7-09 = DSM 18010]